MLKAGREVTITLTMDETYAGKLERSLGRAVTAFDKLDSTVRNQLVNTGTVDNLMALRAAIVSQLCDGA